jgi:hypothetical protein
MKVEPAIEKGAFCCPHCGSYTSHTWFSGVAKELYDAYPFIMGKDHYEMHLKVEHPSDILQWMHDAFAGLPLIEEKATDSGATVMNLNLSKCFVCKKVTVWVHTRVVFPPIQRQGPEPQEGMPTEIAADFQEARSILELSPRGASALLRLCIQKLCAHLGEKGKNIDEDIASLVKKGLDPMVQKAMDTVRVIGNNAVHPGEIDLKDDIATATSLMELVNFVVEQRITRPLKIEKMFAGLPQSKLDGIQKRDAPKP